MRSPFPASFDPAIELPDQTAAAAPSGRTVSCTRWRCEEEEEEEEEWWGCAR